MCAPRCRSYGWSRWQACWQTPSFVCTTAVRSVRSLPARALRRSRFHRQERRVSQARYGGRAEPVGGVFTFAIAPGLEKEKDVVQLLYRDRKAQRIQQVL